MPTSTGIYYSDPVLTKRKLMCRICYEPAEPTQDLHACDDCSEIFCSSCLRMYIQQKVESGQVSPTKLVCPTSACARSVSKELVKQLLAPDAFAKYATFLKNQAHGIRFCPRAGCCAVIQEPLFSTHRRVQCFVCEQESCMHCGDVFHTVPICRRVKDKHMRKWQKKHHVRLCPNCHATIEKTGGCRHMTCTQCDCQFCWYCREPWQAHRYTKCGPLPFAGFSLAGWGRTLSRMVFGLLAGVGLIVAYSGVVVVYIVGSFVAVVATAVVVPAMIFYSYIFQRKIQPMSFT